MACGAGAGLAAVYSVPISGALYTIEHVLSWDISPAAVLPAIATSVIATVAARTRKGLFQKEIVAGKAAKRAESA